MKVIINNASGVPIYEQIVLQIKNQIIAGELKEGELLPSMRLLAKEQRISVITTKRAYEELEREGFIYSVVGKGSFVGPQNIELIREQHLREIEEKMREIFDLAETAGIESEELREMLYLIEEEKKTGDKGNDGFCD